MRQVYACSFQHRTASSLQPSLSWDLFFFPAAAVSFTCKSTRSSSVKCLLEHSIDSLALGDLNVRSLGIYLAECEIQSSCVIKNKWRGMVGKHALDRGLIDTRSWAGDYLRSEGSWNT